MTEDTQGRHRKRRRIWLAMCVVLGLILGVAVPPLVSMSRYKAQITQLIAESLGRHVRLSAVKLRLLPVPGFVLTDLTVDEDPAYGAEPVLHANTVTASIRLLSLWRGRLEISTISVDEASLNVVRTTEGRWNLDSFLRTAAANSEPGQGGSVTPGRRAMPLPYLEATNSRINFKRGAEKLPFSLVETDLSFWQEEPGEWRIRLRGEPARTDLSLDSADTGIVRLEASARKADALREMPLHVDMEWREAQLGQLTRLMIGSDPGWRGDLTGELHLDGTADAALIKTRLRATGVHRAEFAPAAPLDFDASCGLIYHFSRRSMEHLACDSPLGDGRVHVTGEMAGGGVQPKFLVEVDKIPVEAGLDALRTVRSDLGPGLTAAGTVSGKVSYAPVAVEAVPAEKPGRRTPAGRGRGAKPREIVPGPLTGSLTVDGFELSGAGLSAPIRAAKVVLVPVVEGPANAAPGQPAPADRPAALETTVAIPAGGTTPLTVGARLALTGYELTVHGQASVARARELARIAGVAGGAALDAVAGEPMSVDLSAQGPWQPAESAPFSSAAAGLAKETAEKPAEDSFRGTVTLRNANWKADYLANHVQIAQATVHLGGGVLHWEPVVFSYGPVKGTASLDMPARCAETKGCVPKFEVQLGDLDAGVVQAAFLGAREPGTLLTTLLARLRPADSAAAPEWPALEGTVKADSLTVGPVKLRTATATVRIEAAGAEITGLDASVLGGHVHGSGKVQAATGGGKPSYALTGHFEKVNPAELGELLGAQWTGRSMDADGKVELAGFTDKDLGASAKGTIHFDWLKGSVAGADAPAALSRFDRWTADAEIANGAVTLKENEAQAGARRRPVAGSLTFGTPPKISLAAPRELRAAGH